MFDFSGRYDKIFPDIVGLSPLILIGTTSFYDKNHGKLWKTIEKQFLHETRELRRYGELPNQWV